MTVGMMQPFLCPRPVPFDSPVHYFGHVASASIKGLACFLASIESWTQHERKDR